MNKPTRNIVWVVLTFPKKCEIERTRKKEKERERKKEREEVEVNEKQVLQLSSVIVVIEREK